MPLAVGVLWGSRWFCFRRFAQTAAGSRWRSWSTVGTTHTKPDVRIVDTAASARSHLSSWLRKMPSTARPREPAEARAAGLFDRFGQPSKAFHRRSGKTRRQGCHPVCRNLQTTRLVSERPPKARYRRQATRSQGVAPSECHNWSCLQLPPLSPQPLSPWLVNEAQSLSLTIAQPALSRPVRRPHTAKPNKASTIGAVPFHFFIGVGPRAPF